MNTLQHTYKNEIFSDIMKAQFRKYLDKVYNNYNSVLDIERKVEGDNLIIYKIHRTKILAKTMFFVEKVIINRKNKTYNSCINTRVYKEECVIKQNNENVDYIQHHSAPFFMKKNKLKAFNKGCEVIENILKQFKTERNI